MVVINDRKLRSWHFLLASFPLERLEFPFFADSWHCEDTVIGLLYVAGINELLHEIRGHQPTLIIRLHHLDFNLQGVVLRELGLRLLFLEELGLFVFLDLLLGPSALAARLEELGGHTFVGYRIIRRQLY